MHSTNETVTQHDLWGEPVVKVFYLISALRALAISYVFAISINFTLSHGLTQYQAHLNNSVFFLALFVFEIPTGAIADTYGRRISVLIGLVCSGIGGLMYSVSHTLAMFMCCEAVIALGLTFITGAFEAWMIDSLRQKEITNIPSKVFANCQALSQIVTIVGAILGSYLYTKNRSLPWVFAGTTFFWTALIASKLMKEDYFIKKAHSLENNFKHMKETVRVSLSFGRSHKVFRYLMLLGSIQFLFVVPANMFWQPWFSKIVGEGNLGFIWALMMLSLAGGGYLARHSKINSSKESLVLMHAQCSVGLFLILWGLPGTTALSIIPFLAHEIGRGLYLPVKSAYLNHHLPSAERATLISFDSQANHIGAFAGLLISGLLSAKVGLGPTLIIFGFCMTLSSIALHKTLKP